MSFVGIKHIIIFLHLKLATCTLNVRWFPLIQLSMVHVLLLRIHHWCKINEKQRRPQHRTLRYFRKLMTDIYGKVSVCYCSPSISTFCCLAPCIFLIQQSWVIVIHFIAKWFVHMRTNEENGVANKAI